MISSTVVALLRSVDLAAGFAAGFGGIVFAVPEEAGGVFAAGSGSGSALPGFFSEGAWDAGGVAGDGVAGGACCAINGRAKQRPVSNTRLRMNLLDTSSLALALQ